MAGRKNLIRPYKMLDSADLSADAYSPATNVEKVDVISILVDWAKDSTNPSGTLTVECQNGDGAWQTVSYGHTKGVLPTTSLSITVSGASGSNYFLLENCHFEKIRLFYDRTSGDGTMTATLVAKTIGA